MRCLVTGASGLIGSFLVRLLLQKGWEVGALLRPGSDPWRVADLTDRLRLFAGDLGELEGCQPAIVEFAPQVIFHAGWFGVGGPFRNDRDQVRQNLYGSLALLEIARQCGCRRWVGVGSQAEYGLSSGVLREDVPLNPVTLYGAAKAAVGLLAGRLCEISGIGFVWLRLLAVYGPTESAEHYVPYVILSLLRGERPRLTSGEQRWDYLYVEDAATALWRAGTSDGSGVFNVGSGDPHSLRCVATRIRDAIDPRLELGFREVPSRPDQIRELVADSERFRRATGWQPQWSLAAGLERTVAWYREHRRRFEAA